MTTGYSAIFDKFTNKDLYKPSVYYCFDMEEINFEYYCTFSIWLKSVKSGFGFFFFLNGEFS